MTKPKLVIIGGGTAGWLAALILGDAASRAGTELDVTVVESSKIPTIGVGEGTTAIFKSLIDYFGFDETEFLRETKGTIKYGIRYRDWADIGVSYDGPIDDPHAFVDGIELGSEILNIYSVAAGRPVAGMHLFAHLMRDGKAPHARKADGSFEPVGPFQYAYHIDNAAVGAYLRGKAANVKIVDGTVSGIERDGENGHVVRLLLEEGGGVDGDFFIDCTGFRRRLIEKELKSRWVSYVHELPVNRAMPFWLDHEPEAEIAPVTLAWAQSAGWMWQIPTYERLGCGYVYSDEYLTPDEARTEIETALGRGIEPRADIRFDIGRLAEPWMANCLAIGLSQSFLEPLEATSIHGSLVQLMLFSQDYMKRPFQFTAEERSSYNARIRRQLDDFRTFINAHYVTRRNDSPFWRDLRANRIHATTAERLQRWSSEMPKGAHFDGFLSGLPHVEAQLYYPVLDGLGLLDRRIALAEMASQGKLRQLARDHLQFTKREHHRAAGQAIGHRAYLDAVAAM